MFAHFRLLICFYLVLSLIKFHIRLKFVYRRVLIGRGFNSISSILKRNFKLQKSFHKEAPRINDSDSKHILFYAAIILQSQQTAYACASAH